MSENSFHIGVLTGSFHAVEAQEMLDEVADYLATKPGFTSETVRVPGSMEKPLALKRLLERDDIHAAVVLGIIEKGETKHGYVMAQSVVSSIIELQLKYSKPVGVGILGPEIEPEQIPPRVRPYARKAVEAACYMLGEPLEI